MKRVFVAILTAVLCINGNLLAYSGGNGSAGNPYQIANVIDFQQLSNTPDHWSLSFILMANINLTGLTFTQAPIAPDTNNTLENFQGTMFTGTFDGKNHKISHLTIIASTQDYISLFGYVDQNAKIRNIGIENINITGRFYVGGLVGYNGGSLTACYVTGTVAGYSAVGGFVGSNGGTLTASYATGSVNGTGPAVGGLVGYNDSNSLTACYATSLVTGTDSAVGGLVGYNNSGTLTVCCATGSVTGTGSAVGGLVGYNDHSPLTACYATGSVTGTSPAVGGLVGYNNSGTLTACYAAGSVPGTGYVGGLVGFNSAGSIISCFWDTQTSGKTVGVGSGTATGVTGKMTAEMQTLATFTDADWDFTNETFNGTNDYWRMCTDGMDYPRLNRESTSGDFACPDGVNTEDLSFYVGHWLMNNCTIEDSYCGGVDLDYSGVVELIDWAIFAENWLKE
jgi:hypothetical protein